MTDSTSLAQDRSTSEADARPTSRGLAWLAVALGAIAAVGILAALFRRWRLNRKPADLPHLRPPQPQAVLDLQGLTEEEAAARRTASSSAVARWAG